MAIGVVVVGNLSTHTGVSHMNRLLLDTLEVGNFSVHRVPLDDRVRGIQAVAGLERFRRAHDRVVCIASHTVDRLPLLAGFLQREELRDCHRIALWHWEYEIPPEALAQLRHLFSEFWAVSHHAGVGLRDAGGLTVRTFSVPIPVRERPQSTRAAAGLPDRFTFLVVFDHLSLSERKNPQAAIRAFRAAFPHPSKGGPQLIVKTRSVGHMPEAHAQLTAEIGDRPDISIREQSLTDEQQSDLIAAADVLVSLHRAEGYGLALAEAMGAGTVVMGTA